MAFFPVFLSPGIYDAEVRCGVCEHTHYSTSDCPGWATTRPRTPEEFLARMNEAGYDDATVHAWVEHMKVATLVRRARGDLSGRFWHDDMRVLVDLGSGRRPLEGPDGKWVKNEDGSTVLREEVTFDKVRLRPDVSDRVALAERWHLLPAPTGEARLP